MATFENVKNYTFGTPLMLIFSRLGFVDFFKLSPRFLIKNYNNHVNAVMSFSCSIISVQEVTFRVIPSCDPVAGQ
jgi:hypothetical protein